ncbi:30S ribosomal protein S8, partial [Mycobacterium tuberculosis]|nr:30S ribosomal protein S8 [Mycobacterium tuberculosis]
KVLNGLGIAILSTSEGLLTDKEARQKNVGGEVITNLKRVSKPGLRVYKKREDLPKVLNGLGIAILSTSEGLLTDKEARQKNVGGEVI